MCTKPITLYYGTVRSEIIGTEHGVSAGEIDEIAPRVQAALSELQQMRQQGQLAYRDLPYRRDIRDEVVRLTEQLKAECENLVVLGIGGSALGNIALQTALSDPMHNLLPRQRRGGPRLFVMDNVDPVQFSALLDVLQDELEGTIFNVISKSGQTAETATQFLIVRKMLQERFGPAFREHIVATTDPREGTLRAAAAADGYKTLEVPPGVGGRFSVLSAVGLFSAAMCGADIDALLAGAAEMDKRCGNSDIRNNPAAMFAAIQVIYYRKGKPISVMMPYSFQLRDLADWYRQLWAESLGKRKNLRGEDVFIGPTPVKALGATDQHSQIQLYREGPNDKVITLLEVERFARDLEIPAPSQADRKLQYLAGKTMGELLNREKRATEYALLASNRPCLSIIFPEICAHTVGQFIMMMEVATSIAGKLLDVNAYDQPAVQLGKDATFALMGRAGYEQLKEKIETALQRDPQFVV